MQVGLAEAKIAVESTGGILVMAETFDSDQFKKSLQKLFMRDEEGHLKMFFNASVEVMTTCEVKVCGAIGPCSSLHKKGMLGSLHSLCSIWVWVDEVSWFRLHMFLLNFFSCYCSHQQILRLTLFHG
jgi:hypothetical protein